MATLHEVLGFGVSSREERRARALVRADRKFLRDLIAIRKQSGLSQQDVADRLGISQASVAAFERYDNDPKLSTVRRYAHAVDALVAHAVELDRGQLEHGDWIAVGYSMPSLTRPSGVTYSAAPANRVSFALAA